MAVLECCKTKQKAKVYEVSPQANIFRSEIIAFDRVTEMTCKKCGNHKLWVERVSIYGKIIDAFSPKKLLKAEYIKQLHAINEIQEIRDVKYEKRWFLLCSIFGEIEKCHQNLSQMRPFKGLLNGFEDFQKSYQKRIS